MQKAVFLDRDGTIIEDVGYISECNQVRFFPKADEAIRLLNEHSFKVIVISNQAGVARGYFTEERVREVNKHIQESLVKQGAAVDRFYYCPHHVDGIVEEYKKECYCRKPNPGMIEAAVREFDIDLKKSFLIGDKPSDVEAGCRTGCRTVLLAQEAPPSHDAGITPDYIAPDLYQAVEWVLNHPKASSHGKEG